MLQWDTLLLLDSACVHSELMAQSLVTIGRMNRGARMKRKASIDETGCKRCACAVLNCEGTSNDTAARCFGPVERAFA